MSHYYNVSTISGCRLDVCNGEIITEHEHLPDGECEFDAAAVLEELGGECVDEQVYVPAPERGSTFLFSRVQS